MKYQHIDKRLYRDTRQGVISGVCAGVAGYLQIDSVWVRLAAVAALICMPKLTLIAYIAAVILVPRRAG
ncbi:PspC domain-containing protein [Alteromonas aestuariivivens]|uniref:PspC domain-containing protein n=1 Tax=Alteromonas aestuariivivens TaxID=1938339 RepID=A0A3D8M383_9ALTE|nr:PspC domain-containing protein [Alteromonas aestuariivivens]RDV24015.1 PspC domain-containing protein [Alteromonas aestuariivivens]